MAEARESDRKVASECLESIQVVGLVSLGFFFLHLVCVENETLWLHPFFDEQSALLRTRE